MGFRVDDNVPNNYNYLQNIAHRLLRNVPFNFLRPDGNQDVPAERTRCDTARRRRRENVSGNDPPNCGTPSIKKKPFIVFFFANCVFEMCKRHWESHRHSSVCSLFRSSVYIRLLPPASSSRSCASFREIAAKGALQIPLFSSSPFLLSVRIYSAAYATRDTSEVKNATESNADDNGWN